MAAPWSASSLTQKTLGLSVAADGVEQRGQRRIGRPLAGRAAGSAQAAQVAEIGLDRRREFCVLSPPLLANGR